MIRGMGIDLEEFRRSRNLTFEQLGNLIGGLTPSTTQRYAIGQEWPRTERLQQIIDATGGEVDIYAMHRRRLAYMRSNPKPITTIGSTRQRPQRRFLA